MVPSIDFLCKANKGRNTTRVIGNLSWRIKGVKIGFYYLMQQIIMAEELEIAVISDFQRTGKSGPSIEKEQAIFGAGFEVQDMSKPTQYLPQYQQNQNRQKSFVEDCNSCCGLWCICCAYPFALLCCKCCCVYELPTATAGIVEEFGKFSRLINPGFNMINPCTEEIREVDMRIRVITPGSNYCITKDNVKLTISSSIAYRVVNPIQVYYILGNQLNHALVEATHSSIRNVIGETVLDDVLLHRALIIEKSRNLVLKSVPAGVVVENMFIQDIVVPPETMRALSSAARQKRTSQATIINSKADVESASLLKEAAELLDTKAAMQIRYLQMVTELGKKGAKLLLPIGVDKKGFQN